MIAELHKAHPADLSKADVRKAISAVSLAADSPGVVVQTLITLDCIDCHRDIQSRHRGADFDGQSFRLDCLLSAL